MRSGTRSAIASRSHRFAQRNVRGFPQQRRIGRGGKRCGGDGRSWQAVARLAPCLARPLVVVLCCYRDAASGSFHRTRGGDIHQNDDGDNRGHCNRGAYYPSGGTPRTGSDGGIYPGEHSGCAAFGRHRAALRLQQIGVAFPVFRGVACISCIVNHVYASSWPGDAGLVSFRSLVRPAAPGTWSVAGSGSAYCLVPDI